MSGDEVRIDPDQAGKGMVAWESVDTAMTQAVQARLATIQGLEAGAPWGGDGAGQQFAATYPTGSEQTATGITEGTTRLHDLGQDAKTAIGRSLASDEEQAAPVRQSESGFTGSPASGGGGGAGGSGSSGGSGASGGGGGGSSASASAFLSAGGGGGGRGGSASTSGTQAFLSTAGSGGGHGGGRGEGASLVAEGQLGVQQVGQLEGQGGNGHGGDGHGGDEHGGDGHRGGNGDGHATASGQAVALGNAEGHGSALSQPGDGGRPHVELVTADGASSGDGGRPVVAASEWAPAAGQGDGPGGGGDFLQAADGGRPQVAALSTDEATVAQDDTAPRSTIRDALRPSS